MRDTQVYTNMNTTVLHAAKSERVAESIARQLLSDELVIHTPHLLWETAAGHGQNMCMSGVGQTVGYSRYAHYL